MNVLILSDLVMCMNIEYIYIIDRIDTKNVLIIH